MFERQTFSKACTQGQPCVLLELFGFQIKELDVIVAINSMTVLWSVSLSKLENDLDK